MLQRFSVITPRWLDRASYYTGSVGPLGRDFRYRFQQDTENQTIKASVYSRICYEKATDVQEETFPWDEEGIAGCASGSKRTTKPSAGGKASRRPAE